MDNAEGNPANGTARVQAPSTKCADFKNALAIDLDPGASKKEQVANHDQGKGQRDQPDGQQTAGRLLPGPGKSHRHITAADEDRSADHLSRLPDRWAHDERLIQALTRAFSRAQRETRKLKSNALTDWVSWLTEM
jgi:hypothetical protein